MKKSKMAALSFGKSGRFFRSEPLLAARADEKPDPAEH
jgi:hypothetical protein